MAVNKEQVRELLGSGLGPEVVASAVGCDTSYIVQLMSEESFASDVAVLRTKSLTSHSRRDASIDSVEDRLLDQLSEMVDSKAFYKPRDVLSAVSIVNRMVRRGVAASVQGTVINNIVQIQLPTSVLKKFTTNRTNEVVAVEDQTLVTMPAHQLLKNLAALGANSNGGKNVGQYQDALKYLPSGLTTQVRDISPDGTSEV